MRAERVYWAAVGLLAGWLISAKALALWGEALALEGRPPTPVEFILLSFGLWSWRAMPFVVVSAVLLVPFLTLAAAVVVRESGADGRINWEPVTWLAVGVASLCAAAITVWREWATLVAIVFFWSGALGVSLSMALAYRVQVRLHGAGESRVPGWVLLALGFVAPLGVPAGCILVTAFPMWAQWRRRPTRR